MNERIRELAEQAETWNADGDKCEVDLQKFAELIVRECIGIAHEVGRNPFIEAYQERGKIIKKIREHFGVEE
jgi:hypothetical protein